MSLFVNLRIIISNIVKAKNLSSVTNCFLKFNGKILVLG